MFSSKEEFTVDTLHATVDILPKIDTYQTYIAGGVVVHNALGKVPMF